MDEPTPELRRIYPTRRVRHLINNNNQRAKRSGNKQRLKMSDWWKLIGVCGTRCLYCKSPDNITIDHVIPLGAGGANQLWNLQILCVDCNSKKDNMTSDYRTIEMFERLAGMTEDYW